MNILHARFKLSDMFAALEYTKKGSERDLIWKEIKRLQILINDV